MLHIILMKIKALTLNTVNGEYNTHISEIYNETYAAED